MKTTHKLIVIAAALISALAVTATRAADAPKMKMTTAIPPELTTPDANGGPRDGADFTAVLRFSFLFP
jgi:hypothetical protein